MTVRWGRLSSFWVLRLLPNFGRIPESVASGDRLLSREGGYQWQ
jgi:hypothetical protein